MTLGAIFSAWIFAASRSQPYILPGPDRVWSALTANWGNGLSTATTRTLSEALLGWFIGLTVGLPLGYCMARFKHLDWAISPYLAGAQAVPVIAIAPLLLLWVSLGIELKIVLAATISFFPLATTTAAGVRGVDRDSLDVARIFGAGWWQRIVYVEAPRAARTILPGARIGILLAVVGAYIGEFLNPDVGLGAFVLQNIGYASPDATAAAYAGVVCLVVMTAVLYTALNTIETLILRWTE